MAEPAEDKIQIPTVEEFISVALTSSGHVLLTTVSFLGMGCMQMLTSLLIDPVVP